MLVVGFLVLSPHLRHGGFYADDWENAAAYHFDGWWRTSVAEWRHVIPERPILAALHPLPYALLGLDPTYHLIAAVVLAAIASLSFFVLLRVVGIEFFHALALALLSLLFPWSGATRLWPSGAMNNVAIIAYFVGSAIALHALTLRNGGSRRMITLHVGASVLYMISILTYQVATAAILLSGLLYRTRVPWRVARKRWLLDAALVLVLLLVISLAATSRVRHSGSLKQRVWDVPQFLGDGLSIFASIFLPRDVSSSAAKVVVLVAVAAVVVAALLRVRRRGSERALKQWLYVGTAGACVVTCAYLMFLGSNTLLPSYSGIDDRVNTFAAFGFVLATYAVLGLVGLLVVDSRRAAAILAVGTLVVGLGFIQRVRDDVRRYDLATVQQREQLNRLRASLPHPRHGTTIFTFGYPAVSTPGVPIFGKPSDLGGAVGLLWNDPSLSAIPVYERSVSCGSSETRALALEDSDGGAYGHTAFVDLSTGAVRQIASRRDCLEARAVFRPGPLFADAVR